MDGGELLSIKEASEWASKYLGKSVTSSNIAYLIQYGRINKIADDGATYVSKYDLLRYYRSHIDSRESSWKKQLGSDLNWALSFEQYKEAETTKHVHRLHPYKGKFIPQLVEYFLDGHTDSFKKNIYFCKGDIVLDPFAGSGTTLVQANELGMHALGIDVAGFNVFVSNCKIGKYDIKKLETELGNITQKLANFRAASKAVKFDEKLSVELNEFNNKYFPSPEYKRRLQLGEIDGNEYGKKKEREFQKIFEDLVSSHNIELKQASDETFLEKWYLQNVRDEIGFVFEEIKKIQTPNIKRIAALVLSRTMRSCRSTTHADLATLLQPIAAPYYCSKHGKICKPLLSIARWWGTYAKDTCKRLAEFNKLRTDTLQICLAGDSRTMNIPEELAKRKHPLEQLLGKQKIKGIFSSPPYVGLIAYHEQHAYAYELFGLERKDEKEIGLLFDGQGREAQQRYVQGISDVLDNCRGFLVDDFEVFLVANDKYGLYPRIAEKAGMQIVDKFKRPVLNRTEKDKGAYAETIFHLKRK